MKYDYTEPIITTNLIKYDEIPFYSPSIWAVLIGTTQIKSVPSP